MGISNQIPNSRIAQAGVIPDTANRPASPYEGQMLYQKDTNQVLVYDGSAWVAIADTDQPPGLQLVKTQTIGTTVGSVVVADAFNSDFDAYRIIVSGGVGSGDTLISLKLGASGTGYYSGGYTSSYSAGTVSGANDNNAATFTRAGVATTNAISLDVTLVNPHLAKTTLYESVFIGPTSTSSGGKFAGFHDVATSYTEFTLATTSPATLTGGTVRVYGYRN